MGAFGMSRPSSVSGIICGLCQRHLPGKDLDALNAHGAVAGLCSGQADNGVGAGGVVLVQREGAGGGFNGDIGGAAGRHR